MPLPRLVVNVMAFGAGRHRWVHPTNTSDYGGLGGYRVQIYEGPDGPFAAVDFREVRSGRSRR